MAIITAAEAKVLETTLADGTFTDAQINSAIAEFEELVETYCNRRYVSATVTHEVATRPLPQDVVLPDVAVSSVTATVDGVAVDMTNVTVVELDGVLRNMPWTGLLPISAAVTYTAGSTAPLAIKRAAAIFTMKVLGQSISGTSGDVKWTSPDGTSFLETADVSRGRPTPWKDVNAALNLYRIPLGFQ
jgi:hypothetical protein